MDPRHDPLRSTPAVLTAELTRYGGVTPFGDPLWRVVLAQNVREQTFGTMRHMPVLKADDVIDGLDVEPESFSSGEIWVQRYNQEGWILERWFPAHAWGSQVDWEYEKADDGETRLKGEFPRKGDYFMVNDEYLTELPGVSYWKEEIQKTLMAHIQVDESPAALLSRKLYMHKVSKEMREEAYREEVNRIHRSIVAPTLATIGRTAQRLRDELRVESGYGFHIAAG